MKTLIHSLIVQNDQNKKKKLYFLDLMSSKVHNLPIYETYLKKGEVHLVESKREHNHSLRFMINQLLIRLDLILVCKMILKNRHQIIDPLLVQNV
jgi:hypothetical protein